MAPRSARSPATPIDKTGLIKGTFTNGLSRTLGQVALATFRNNQGLIDEGNNNWQAGPNSGTAVISAPGAGSTGSIVAGALELSNVDLSAEFVELISARPASPPARASSPPAIKLLQELMAAGR